MRALRNVLLFMIVSTVVTRVAALFVSRRLDAGSEVSDEIRRAVVLNGLDFTSRARGLRSAEVSVLLGGARIDLRQAVLDPAGARMLVKTTLGGLLVTVRDDWAVTVNETLIGGGQIEVKVTPPEDLPEDAPQLRIDLIARLGGAAISTDTPGF